MEEELMDSPMAFPQPMGGGSLAAEGALQYQFENPNLVDTMEHTFLCETEIIEDGMRKWIKIPGVKPMINYKGLSKIRGFLTMFLIGSKNFALTDVSDQYIGESVINIGRIIMTDFMDNWNIYEIKDYASASFMVETITDVAYTIKKKGEGATYLKFLTKTHHVSEMQTHNGQQRQQQNNDGGLMEMLFNKKRR